MIGIEAAQDLGGGRDADVVFGEIDAGFEQRDEFQQLRLDGREAARDRALRLLRGDARLVERGGFDQIADGFGLGEIDAAVEESAQREFARFGEARARAHGAVEAVPQDDGRAMAGDFDHVFGGVGTRRGEVGDDDFIDHAAFVVEQFAEGGVPRDAVRPSARSGSRSDVERLRGRRGARRRCRRGRAGWKSRQWCRSSFK